MLFLNANEKQNEPVLPRLAHPSHNRSAEKQPPHTRSKSYYAAALIPPPSTAAIDSVRRGNLKRIYLPRRAGLFAKKILQLAGSDSLQTFFPFAVGNAYDEGLIPHCTSPKEDPPRTIQVDQPSLLNTDRTADNPSNEDVGMRLPAGNNNETSPPDEFSFAHPLGKNVRATRQRISQLLDSSRELNLPPGGKQLSGDVFVQPRVSTCVPRDQSVS